MKKKLIIGKCNNCNNWHIHLVFVIGENMLVDLGIVATFTKWWDEVLIAINFPEMVE